MNIMMMCENDVVVAGVLVFAEGHIYEAEVIEENEAYVYKVNTPMGIGIISEDDQMMKNFRNPTDEELDIYLMEESDMM